MDWFFPAWNGDHRLIQDGDGSRLLVMCPTDHEREILNAFLAHAHKKKWISSQHDLKDEKTAEIALTATVAKAGKALIKFLRPEKPTLTAVKYENGKLLVTEGQDERALDAVLDEKKAARAAVSVRRPTISCPNCQPGAVGPASEVLQHFMTPEQHDSWSKRREIVVIGQLSGHRYILSHRNTPRAVANKRICMDVDSRAVLHFHDWTVPPEEEVLAAKLVLEHREPWLRNEASLFHVYQDGRVEPLFKNPFGNMQDGVIDATMVKALGFLGQTFAPGTYAEEAGKHAPPAPKKFVCQIPAWA